MSRLSRLLVDKFFTIRARYPVSVRQVYKISACLYLGLHPSTEPRCASNPLPVSNGEFTMKIGVAAETQAGETRVAATPETIKKLVAQGHTVCVQTGAGVAASCPDSAYEVVGASIVDAAGALGCE